MTRAPPSRARFRSSVELGNRASGAERQVVVSAAVIRTGPSRREVARRLLKKRAGRGPSAAGRIAGPALLGRFEQAFGFHPLLDLGARGDAFHIGLHVRPLPEIDRLHLGPIQDGEKKGIGHGELVARQVLATGRGLRMWETYAGLGSSVTAAPGSRRQTQAGYANCSAN
jgi:hypothetical protein